MPKSLRTKVLAYAQKQYDTLPDKTWAKYPDNEVLRHGDTRKWYGLIFHTEWLSILLDGTVPLKTVCNLLDISYTLFLYVAAPVSSVLFKCKVLEAV